MKGSTKELHVLHGSRLLVGILLAVTGLALVAKTATSAGASQQPASQPEYREVRWSPDGKSLAVVMRTEPKSRLRIAVIPADGGAPRWVSPESPGAMTPRWSPDGGEIAFLTGESRPFPQELVVTSADAGSTHAVARTDQPLGLTAGYTWKLDGRGFQYFFTVTNSQDSSPGHYTMDLSGHATRTPGATPTSGMLGIEWSADQSQITFDAGQPSHLYIAGSHGENAHPVAGTEVGAVAPSWSPDGRTLLYSVYRRPTAGPTLWSIGIDGKGNRSLAADGIRGQFSPDGQWIAYIDTRGTNSPANPSGSWSYHRVCKARPDGSGVVVIAR